MGAEAIIDFAAPIGLRYPSGRKARRRVRDLTFSASIPNADVATPKHLMLGFAQSALLATAGLAATAHGQCTSSVEYAIIGYEHEAEGNPVACLQDEMLSGALQLEYGNERGHFDALLERVRIDSTRLEGSGTK